MKAKTFIPRFQLIPISQMEPDPQQPRKELDLLPMVSSIKKFGITNPITVRQHEDKFIIIAGERRFRACKELKFSEVPAYIDVSDVDPANTRMVLETHKKDFTALEEAELFKHVQDVNKFSNQQLAEWSHKSKSHISGILKVAALSNAEKEKVRHGELSLHTAIRIAQKAPEEREKEFRRLLAPAKKATVTPTLSAMLTNKEVDKYETKEIERLKKKLLAAPVPKDFGEWKKLC